jgi:LysR family transcriptional regulator, hydrogen peroxide-inducible genes activator
MTLTQIQYIVAVEKNGSFVTAAEKCFVTQPTLSMQIQKLEEELGVKIFDRNHHPIIPTDVGKTIIEQAKIVLYEKNKIDELLLKDRKDVEGILNVGIIPTVAPCILPRALQSFVKKNPKVDLTINEMTTQQIIDKLKSDELDFGILSTPLKERTIKETPLYDEPYVVYAHKDHSILSKKAVAPTDLDPKEIWSLNDEHCMHFQVVNLCGKKKFRNAESMFDYRSGSLMSLIRMVEINGGYTLLPELCLSDFPEDMMGNIRFFKSPIPVREIGIATNKYFTKNKLLNSFKQSILDTVPEEMLKSKKKKFKLPIN